MPKSHQKSKDIHHKHENQEGHDDHQNHHVEMIENFKKCSVAKPAAEIQFPLPAFIMHA